jgi:hypothetical protein
MIGQKCSEKRPKITLSSAIEIDFNNGVLLPGCTIIDIPSLIEWCLQRQGADGGLQICCYS